MTNRIDFILNVFSEARSQRFGLLGWAVTMPEETDGLTRLTAAASRSNKNLGVIQGEYGATTFAWTRLLAKADYAPRILHE